MGPWNETRMARLAAPSPTHRRAEFYHEPHCVETRAALPSFFLAKPLAKLTISLDAGASRVHGTPSYFGTGGAKSRACSSDTIIT